MERRKLSVPGLLVLVLAFFITPLSHAQSDDRSSLRQAVAPDYPALKQQTEAGQTVRVMARAAERADRGNARQALQRALSAADRAGVQPRKTFDRWGLAVLELDAQALDRVIDSGQFESIQAEGRYELQLQDSAQRVGALDAHAGGFTGTGDAVAVIDSGVDVAHPFFGGRIAGEACFATHDPDAGDYSTCPDEAEVSIGPGSGKPCEGVWGQICDHGTHVAGIAAGFGTDLQGIAPSAEIVPINVITRQLCPDDEHEICYTIYESDLIEAMAWVLDNADAMSIASVNLSLSGGLFSGSCNNHILAPVVDDLTDAGIAVAAASGNSGAESGIGAPACISSAISVGSTESTNDSLSSFSNSSLQLEMLAPGDSITSAFPDGEFGLMSGTSMATPHVAGAFAVLSSAAAPDTSVDYLRQVMVARGWQVLDMRNYMITPRLDLMASLNTVTQSSCTSAPATPSRPTTTATTDHSVVVDWDEVAGADLYTVQMWDFNDGQWRDATSTEFTGRIFAGLSEGPHYFRVRAVNQCGESGYDLFAMVQF